MHHNQEGNATVHGRLTQQSQEKAEITVNNSKKPYFLCHSEEHAKKVG